MGTPNLWLRGEAAGGPVSSPGGSIHDFGDGMYLTDRFDVAKQYAETRTADPSRQLIVAVTVDFRGLKVLDLREDARWGDYFKDPGGDRVKELIESGRMNELYGQTFNDFLKKNNIDRTKFDLIIGPEYVRGGLQMCVVQKGSSPSELAVRLRSQFKPATVGPPQPVAKRPYQSPQVVSTGPIPRSLGENFTMPNNPMRRMARNQNAMAALGIALESGMMWLQQKGIAREVKRRLETSYKNYLQQAFDRGEGVLVIVYMEEWILPDVNGFHPKMMLGVGVEAGRTRDLAMDKHLSTPSITPGPSSTLSRPFEQYQWISPNDEM